MMLSGKLRVAAPLLMLALVGAMAAWAQNAPAPDGRGNTPQEGQERLIKTFLDHATVELNLTEEQRSGLEGVMRESMQRRGELSRNQVRLRREIMDALANPSTGDGEFNRLAESSLQLKRREVELMHWQQQRLTEVLTPRQALRFMLMQERLAQRIEAMRRNRNR
jgi:Spy/CpxP family protein refolding chaperone